jgi:predicted DNA-binding protein
LLKDFEVILNSDSLNKRISRAKASVIQEAIKAIKELEEEARTGIMTTETILENAMDMKQGIRDLDEA